MSALNWTPAQAGQLELKNVRVTYGILGQERKDSTYLPGDMVVVTFDIEGLTVAADGTVKYSTGMVLTDKLDKKLFEKDPQELLTANTLGGSRVPAFALTRIGTDQAAGQYTMTVTVSDVAAKDKPTVKLVHKFDIKPLQFGIVRPSFKYLDMREGGGGGEPLDAPPLAVPGQSLLLDFAVVGFELKGDMQQPDLSVKMEILDETGQPVLKKPFTGVSKNLDPTLKKFKVNPMQFPMQINRSGKFKIVLTATDNNTPAKKTVTQTLDLKVVEVN